MKLIIQKLCILCIIFIMAGCGSKNENNIGDIENNTLPIDQNETNDNNTDHFNNNVDIFDLEDSEVDSELKIDKYNAYIELYNFTANSLSNILAQYKSSIGLTNTYLENRDEELNMSIGLVSPSDIEIIETAYDYANKLPSTIGDNVVRSIYEPLITMILTLNSAYEYYENQGYIDDSYAKGEEYHLIIMENYDIFYELWPSFKEVMDKMVNESLEDSLRYYEEEGYLIRYYSLLLISRAEALRENLAYQEAYGANIININLEEFFALYNSFVEVLADLKFVSSEIDTILFEEIDPDDFELFMFCAEILNISADEIIVRVQNQEPIDESIDPNIYYTINGTYEKLLEICSELVRSYNKMV